MEVEVPVVVVVPGWADATEGDGDGLVLDAATDPVPASGGPCHYP